MSRKGFIRRSGSCSSACLTPRSVVMELTVVTTVPRLTGFVCTRVVIAYQLIRAKVVPLSFSAIQVPPPVSDGARIFRPWTDFSAGGSPVARDNFSSRFIANA